MDRALDSRRYFPNSKSGPCGVGGPACEATGGAFAEWLGCAAACTPGFASGFVSGGDALAAAETGDDGDGDGDATTTADPGSVGATTGADWVDASGGSFVTFGVAWRAK